MNNEQYKEHLQQLLVRKLYSGKILNNSHRGDVLEMMVLDALGDEWRYVGLGWHPWDLQKGFGKERVRIQVKQCAMLQLWGKTKNPIFSFPWSASPPSYFRLYNPDEEIENEGWFCELFVVGVHLHDNPNICDQMDVEQWQFMVVPTLQLESNRSSMKLAKALELWPPIKINDLKEAVEQKIVHLRQ